MSSARFDTQDKSIISLYHSRLLAIGDGLLSSLESNFQVTTYNILSLACGEFPYEIEALTAFFHQAQKSFNYIGIDTDREAISINQRNYQHCHHIKFHLEDITAIDNIKLILDNQPVHLIISRHPILFLNNPAAEVFKYAFLTTVPYLLAPGGTLLASLFYQQEAEHFCQMLPPICTNEIITLPEDPSNHCAVESVCYGLTEISAPKSYDHYFFAVINFKPTQAIVVEKNNNLADKITDEIFSQTVTRGVEIILAAMLTENYLLQNQTTMQNFLLNIVNTLIDRKSQITECSLPRQVLAIIEISIKAIDKNNFANTPGDVLEKISWSLVKRVFDEKTAAAKITALLTSIMRIIMKQMLYSIKYDFANFKENCLASLELIARRPLLLDLIAQPPATNQDDVFSSRFDPLF
jgi:hypothetical protein